MKIFKLMAVALVAMVALNSCSEDCDHNYMEHDYSKDIVGTWNILVSNHAEAMVVNADGTMKFTVVSEGELIEQSAHYELEGNRITITYDDMDIVDKGRLDVVPGVGISIMLDEEEGLGYKYYYCYEDFSDEIVGMWVCTETPSAEENDMLIMTYNADGTTSFSGYFYETDDFGANMKASYQVIGDLLIHKQPDIALEMGLDQYTAMKIKYSPNANSLGDMMTLKAYAKVGEKYIETNTSWLRVKQSLSLAEKSYDYSNLYLSNVKGKDKDINFWGYTMNLAKMDGSGIDKMLKAILFHMEFPDAKTLSYTYTMGTNQETYSAPIEVEGNKLTVKMSQRVPTLKDVVFYAFQDAKDGQLHLYMHRDSFVNFYTNMQAMLMIVENPQFDITNAEAIEAIYNNINDAVETINLSITMKAN